MVNVNQANTCASTNAWTNYHLAHTQSKRKNAGSVKTSVEAAFLMTFATLAKTVTSFMKTDSASNLVHTVSEKTNQEDARNVLTTARSAAQITSATSAVKGTCCKTEYALKGHAALTLLK